MEALDSVKEKFGEVRQEMNTRPGYEVVMQRLIELELLVRNAITTIHIDVAPEAVSTDSDRHIANREQMVRERKIIEQATGVCVNIDDLLGELSMKISNILDISKPPEVVMYELQIFCRKLAGVILNPEKTIKIITGSGVGMEKHQGFNKFALLIDVLRTHGIYADDLSVASGDLFPNQTREETYYAVAIPRINRTILVCNAYAEATFVYEGTLTDEVITTNEKKPLRQQYKGRKISFFQDRIEEWKTKISVALFFEIPSNITTSDESLHTTTAPPPNPLGKKVDIEQYEFYRQSILKQFPTAESFIALSTKEKIALKIPAMSDGVGLRYIANSIFRLEGLSPLASSRDMAKLARKIYGEGHECIEIELWTQEQWTDKIKQDFPTPESFMNISQEDKMKLTIPEKEYGRGLTYIANFVFGFTKLSPIGSSKDMAKLAQRIYGKGHECIEIEFWTPEQWIEQIKKDFPTPEGFMDISKEDKTKLKIPEKEYGRGLTYIANSIFRLEELSPLASSRDMAKLARRIYGEGHECIEIELWTPEQWIEQIKKDFPTPENFIALSEREKLKLKIPEKEYGRGLTHIANFVFGFTRLNPIGFSKDMAKLARRIYGEGHECIEVELWTPEQWIERIKKDFPTPESFMNISLEDKIKLKIPEKEYGRGLTYIANTVFEFTRLLPLASSKDMAKLAQRIYGEGHECIEVELWTPEQWIERIKKDFPTPESFMGLTVNEISILKIPLGYGKSLKYIANSIFRLGGLDPASSSSNLAKLAQRIYGKGHECIEVELWTPEQWIEQIKQDFPDPATLMALTVKEKNILRIPIGHGKSLRYIANSIFQLGRLDPPGKSTDMAVLIQRIYN